MKALGVVAIALLAGSSFAQAKVQSSGTTKWLRAQELPTQNEADAAPSGYRLEVAARRYKHPDQDLAVTLVGVVHIGDQSYFEDLQVFLDRFDVVLFESIAPSGGAVLEEGTAEERAEHTRQALMLLGGAVRTHRFRNDGQLPPDLQQLAFGSAEHDSRMPRWLNNASRDGWGGEILLERIPAVDDGLDARDGWRLTSLGADGVIGSDDIVHSSDDPDPRARGGPGLQAQLASALGLSFQLQAIDYNDDRFVLADMTMRELRKSARAKDVDMGPMLESLSGSSIPARLVKAALFVVRLADFISGNQVRDIIKVVLVEALADPEALEKAQRDGIGLPGFERVMEVILLERNSVALAGLDRALDAREGGEIALLYGAAHNPGLADGLRQRGFSEVGEPVWLGAIEIDLGGSNVDPRTVEQVRRTMRTSLGAQRRSRNGRATGKKNGPIE